NSLMGWLLAIAGLVILLVIYIVFASRFLPQKSLLNQIASRWRYDGVLGKIASHLILISWALVVIVPFWTMLVNSVKDKKEIFDAPFEYPQVITFAGYNNAWVDGNFAGYFKNSVVVSVNSIILILIVGTLAAYALMNWRSRKSSAIYFYFLAGLMVPIRLGTINIITTVQQLGLSGRLEGLIFIYTAMGIPITIFILRGFMQSIPTDLIEAARIDGASELMVVFMVIMPLLRPALATAAIFNFIPIYNDLWFPLILTRAENVRTVTYGVSLLFGEYQTDWNAILSTLSLASMPVLILYLLMSKQFIRGLTAGAVKG
ncbi:MAG TPA: carbohydrate ABC transporter permease, partial [Aggregatilineales bacterium]|nr:carbohydrate ABC transporter permease [Aggregatilineales bacterium]